MKNAFILIAAANPCGLQSRPGLPRSTNCGFFGSAFGGCFIPCAAYRGGDGQFGASIRRKLEAFASNFLLY